MVDVPHVLHEGDVRKIVESILGTSPPSSGGGGGSGGGLLWIDPENIPTDLVGPVSSWGTFNPTNPAHYEAAEWHVVASGSGKYRVSFLEFNGMTIGTGPTQLSPWAPNTTYSANCSVKPTIQNDMGNEMVYWTESGGTSGTVEPTWVDGNNNDQFTDADGITWTLHMWAGGGRNVQLLDVTSDEAVIIEAVNTGSAGTFEGSGMGTDFVVSGGNGPYGDANQIRVFDKDPDVTVTITATNPGAMNYFVPPNGSTYEWVDLATGMNPLYVFDATYGGKWYQPTQYDYEYANDGRHVVWPARVYHGSGGGSTGPVVTQGSGTLTYGGTWEGPTEVQRTASSNGNQVWGTFHFSGSAFNFVEPTAGEAGQPIIVDVSSWTAHFNNPPLSDPESWWGMLGYSGDDVTAVIGNVVGTLGGVPFLGVLRIAGDKKMVICGSNGAPVTTALMVGDQLWLSGEFVT